MDSPVIRPRELISTERIQARVAQLAEAIARDHAGVSPNGVLLVGVLKGAFIFLADLARALPIPNAVDFLALSSYGTRGSKRGGVRVVMDLRESVRDRQVIVVEDIVDTGHTLAYVRNMLTLREPASLRTCALVVKPSRHEVDIPLDYVGFEIGDEWAVGYGLDYKDRYRTLPYIGVVPGDS
ncbi:MAG: hypoxanthine phosphoribosyltransferase [Gemmatimonadota bacterium]|nr:hypoxanthine phosphoribosyltransferase [Gemmatimonadota bacterium]